MLDRRSEGLKARSEGLGRLHDGHAPRGGMNRQPILTGYKDERLRGGCRGHEEGRFRGKLRVEAKELILL